MTQKCKSCGAPVIWARTILSNTAVPLDAEPTTDGNIRLLDGRAIALSHYPQRVESAELLYTSHATTCPDMIRRRQAQ